MMQPPDEMTGQRTGLVSQCELGFAYEFTFCLNPSDASTCFQSKSRGLSEIVEQRPVSVGANVSREGRWYRSQLRLTREFWNKNRSFCSQLTPDLFSSPSSASRRFQRRNIRIVMTVANVQLALMRVSLMLRQSIAGTHRYR